MGLTDQHAHWLESRALTVEEAAKHGVTSRDPWIAFPYLEGQTERYAKLRTMDKRFKTEPAGVPANLLWNANCLAEEPGTNPLIIAEGELDAMSFLEAGFQFVVSVPTGAPDRLPDDEQLPAPPYLLERSEPPNDAKPMLKREIQKFTRVVLATDGDRAGVHLRHILANTIGAGYCWVPSYPDGCKDANDVLRAKGVEGVRELIDRAQPLKSDGFVPLTDIDARHPPTHSCGMDFLDPHFKVILPEFVVIGGAAGSGKTTVCQAVVFGLCWRNNWRASLFAGEGAKSIVLQRARRFFKRLSGANTADPAVQQERDGWIREHLGLIQPPQDELPTFEWFLWAMEQQALHRNRQVFVIDPWNQVIKQRPAGVSVTDWTGEAIYRMKALAARYNLLLIVVHHVRKPEDSKRIPNPYELADSAHWYNAADHCLLVHRLNEAENRTTLWMAKTKDHEFMGKPGKVVVGLRNESFELQPIIGDTPAEGS